MVESRKVVFFNVGSIPTGAANYLRDQGFDMIPIASVDQVKTMAGGLPEMTLRQWYAGQALGAGLTHSIHGDSAEGIARSALEIADALIKEESHG